MREALYGLGYMHAIDRPTQMLFARAVASGQSAELIAAKPELLEMDRLFHRVGLYQHLDDEVADLDDETFDQLTAYCEGVNDGMKDSGRSLPMWAVGFVPQPWNQRSVLLMGNLLAYGGLVVGQQENERILLELIQAGVAPEKLRELFSPLLDDADFDLLRKINMTRQMSDEALELITDLPRLAGSNAWAVSPKRSATGGALLASDPHLEVNRLPAIWYEAELHWGTNGEHYVMGATLPGCPLFAVARNRHVAWGVTYLKGDTADHFIEDCRTATDGTLQYRRGDSWHEFQVREAAPGAKAPRPKPCASIPTNKARSTPNCHQARAATISRAGGSATSRARGVRSLPGSTWSRPKAPPKPWTLPASARCRRCAGCSPTARVTSACKPTAGSRSDRTIKAACCLSPPGTCAIIWRGRLGTNVLPCSYDPPEGFVATANENVNKPGQPMLVTLPVPDYRKRRIVERLREMPAATIEDMQSLQYDVISLQARDLLAVFLPCMPEGPIKEQLANWDCNYKPESYEATLFSHLYRNVLLEIFGHEENIGWRRMMYLCSRVGFSTMVLTAIDRLLVKDESLWWRGRDKAELIRKAAARLEGEKQQPWSVTNGFQFTNRFVESRFVGRTIGWHTREMALPGCYATPFQGHLLRAARREASFAPSYHFVTDLATDEAWTNLPGGPSESLMSGYYKNDIPRWLSGQYKRLGPEAMPQSV